MLLRGIININDMTLSATINIEDVKPREKGVSFCAHVGENGKWRAYHSVRGKTVHDGYYETKAEALEAARQRRSIRTDKPTPRNGIFRVQRAGGVLWRSSYTPSVGRALRLGEYPTKGAAILVRDVVARRSGGIPMIVDYEMPLSFVTNVIARSFILDIVPQATPADLAEYERRVAELSGIERLEAVKPPVLTLPAEVWRQQQPSRSGRSPFDVIDG